MREAETLIIGGGATGVALARALALRGGRGIVLAEKEKDLAVHTSGRNSGVAHAGYNQKPGTLKARLCVEGNRRLREFCKKRAVPLVEGGILIVARTPAEIPRLEELLRRGGENGVPGLRLVERDGIAAIEPNAAGVAGLHAPSGASVDSRGFVRALGGEAREAGVEVRITTAVAGIDEKDGGFEARLKLSGGGAETLRARRLVNCAGLHADRIAHALGAGLDVGIVPIRGEYRDLVRERAHLLRSMVYPVPDLEFPFLGVHWTKGVHGDVHIGPNAVPALGREAYSWSETRLGGALELAIDRRAWKLLGQPGFPTLLWSQLRTSLSTARFVEEARALVPAARVEDFGPGSAGIRAQLVDRSGKMVDDLLVEQKGNALHVLNVVSPGLTCSMAFAEELADRLG